MSVVDSYIDVPVSNRFGCGCYTYKCVFDSSETGIIKVEIFADNVEQAISLIACNYWTISSWNYISNDIVAITFSYGMSGTCLLYI